MDSDLDSDLKAMDSDLDLDSAVAGLVTSLLYIHPKSLKHCNFVSHFDANDAIL